MTLIHERNQNSSVRNTIARQTKKTKNETHIPHNNKGRTETRTDKSSRLVEPNLENLECGVEILKNTQRTSRIFNSTKGTLKENYLLFSIQLEVFLPPSLPPSLPPTHRPTPPYPPILAYTYPPTHPSLPFPLGLYFPTQRRSLSREGGRREAWVGGDR